MSRRWSSRISDGNSSTTPLAASGSLTPTFRSAASAVAADGSNAITISKPAGVVQDDVMVATINLDDDNIAITPPTGWTLIRSDDASQLTNSISSALYWLRAGAAEPANYTWTFDLGGTNTQDDAVGAIVAYDNIVAAGNPVNAHSGAVEGPTVAGDTTVTAPSAAGVTAGSMLIGFFCTSAVDRTFTPPAGMTERVDNPADTSHAVADQIFGAGGNTGQRVAIVSDLGTGQNNIGQLVALTPAVAGGGGKFFGVAEEVTDFSNIRILYETDQFPSANGLEPQFSTDGTNWITFEKFPKAGLITGLGQIARAEQVTVRGRFFRLNYENGSAAQTFFRLQTILVPEADQDPSRAPDAGRMYTGTGNIDPDAYAAHAGTTLSGRDHTAAVEILGYGATPLKSTNVGAAFDYVVRLVFGAQTVHQQIVRGDDKAFVPLRILVNPNTAPKVEILHNQVLAQNFLSFLQVREF